MANEAYLWAPLSYCPTLGSYHKCCPSFSAQILHLWLVTNQTKLSSSVYSNTYQSSRSLRGKLVWLGTEVHANAQEKTHERISCFVDLISHWDKLLQILSNLIWVFFLIIKWVDVCYRKWRKHRKYKEKNCIVSLHRKKYRQFLLLYRTVLPDTCA